MSPIFLTELLELGLSADMDNENKTWLGIFTELTPHFVMCSGREMKMWLHPECVGMSVCSLFLGEAMDFTNVVLRFSPAKQTK